MFPKGNGKVCSNYCTIALISHACEEILKILQAKLQQHMNCELLDVQAGFRKGRGTRDQIANTHSINKIPEKHVFLLNLVKLKSLTAWITTNCGKFSKRWEYQTTLPASWKTCMQVREQQLKPDMEQQTGSKLGKEHIKAAYCHSAYVNYMQSTSWEMPG